MAAAQPPPSAGRALKGGPLELLRKLNGLRTVGGTMCAIPFRRRRPAAGMMATRNARARSIPRKRPRDAARSLEESRMDKDRIEGAAKQAKGAVKDAAGKVMGDKKMQAEGKADKAEGKVQNTVGGAKDTVRDATDKV